MWPIVSIILWGPALFSLLLWLIPQHKHKEIKIVSLAGTSLVLLATIFLFSQVDFSLGHILPETEIILPWIEQFSIYYRIGMDGLSAPMILLTSLIFFLCVLASWHMEKSLRAYFSLLLLLQTCVYGVFFSLDFFLFYVFWEVMLIPMFFLIALWGGDRREYAAIKFFLYTFFGSLFLLLVMVGLYFLSGKTADSFNLLALAGGKFSHSSLTFFGVNVSLESLFFVFLFIAFAVKVPVFPFHTWLPHAHVQAPTAISVILAGVLLKMGTYGFLRISYPLFPQAAIAFSDIIGALGLISVIYGALCAMAQTDIKRLVAYSSVSHMGLVMMGIASLTPAGLNGAVLQMFNHGTSTAMLFLLIGILYERSHHRWIVRPNGQKGFSGLYTQMPKFSLVFILAMFASMGLPGLSGFISEALIFFGIFPKFTLMTCLAVIGLLLGAAYLLWLFKRAFFGEVLEEMKQYTDMTCWELCYMAPLCVAVIFLGIFPAPLLNVMKASVSLLHRLVTNVQGS